MSDPNSDEGYREADDRGSAGKSVPQPDQTTHTSEHGDETSGYPMESLRRWLRNWSLAEWALFRATKVEVWEAIFSFCMVMFTFALTYTSKKQWDATEASNQLARLSIDMSRQTAEAIERPWVLFDEFPKDNPRTDKPENNWISEEGVGLFLRNFGKGPAFNVRWVAWLVADQRDFQPNATPRGGAILSSVIYQGIMLPQDEATQTVSKFEWVPDPICIDTGSVVMEVVEVQYVDQFGKGHRTTFCVYAQMGSDAHPINPCVSTNYAD